MSSKQALREALTGMLTMHPWDEFVDEKHCDRCRVIAKARAALAASKPRPAQLDDSLCGENYQPPRMYCFQEKGHSYAHHYRPLDSLGPIPSTEPRQAGETSAPLIELEFLNRWLAWLEVNSVHVIVDAMSKRAREIEVLAEPATPKPREGGAK